MEQRLQTPSPSWLQASDRGLSLLATLGVDYLIPTPLGCWKLWPALLFTQEGVQGSWLTEVGLSSMLLCQLIPEDTALSLLGKANGGLFVCIFPDLLPQGTPCTDIVARPSFRTWEPVSTALPGLTPTCIIPA